MASKEKEDESVQNSEMGIKDDSLQLAEEHLKKPLHEALGDVARFSYLATYTTSIGMLYPDEWHQKWRHDGITQLRKHLHLDKDLFNVMEQMITENKDKKDQETFVKKLLEDPTLVKPELIPQDLMTLSLQTGGYDARTRVVIYHFCELFEIDPEKILKFEQSLVENFIQAQAEMTEEEKEEKRKKEVRRKVRRYFAIGAATIAGGALIGLTGGLAAPLVATASVALLGPGVAFLATQAGIVALASVFGVAGAGLSGYKMNKRVGEVEEFEFEALTEGKDLHVSICVSGWLTKEKSDNFYMPWMTLDNSREIYCLKWESKYLMDLGESLEYILNKVMTIAAKEALKYTVLAGLLAALALPATAYASLTAIDNPWGIATNRAAEVGKQLAEVLLMRHQGKRPTTLIGFSMGARVIYFCLKELASRKGSEGIIQDVCLLGAPVPYKKEVWDLFPRIVAGKIYNGYCRGDWLLQFVYRTASAQVTDIVGLDAVPWKHNCMVNVDLTDVVSGHLDYSDKMDTVLKHMGFKQKERRKSASLNKLAQMKIATKEQKPGLATSGPLEGEEEIPCIDAKDLNLSLTKEKMGKAAGFSSSDVTKSPSLNLTKNTARDEGMRSQSMGAMSGLVEDKLVAGGNRDANDNESQHSKASQEMEERGMSKVGGERQKVEECGGNSVPSPEKELCDEIDSIQIQTSKE